MHCDHSNRLFQAFSNEEASEYHCSSSGRLSQGVGADLSVFGSCGNKDFYHMFDHPGANALIWLRMQDFRVKFQILYTFGSNTRLQVRPKSLASRPADRCNAPMPSEFDIDDVLLLQLCSQGDSKRKDYPPWLVLEEDTLTLQPFCA